MNRSSLLNLLQQNDVEPTPTPEPSVPRRVQKAAVGAQLFAYKAALTAVGPASDHEVARVTGMSVKAAQRRRSEWQARGCIVATGRVRITHPDGSTSPRTLWQWVGE